MCGESELCATSGQIAAASCTTVPPRSHGSTKSATAPAPRIGHKVLLKCGRDQISVRAHNGRRRVMHTLTVGGVRV